MHVFQFLVTSAHISWWCSCPKFWTILCNSVAQSNSKVNQTSAAHRFILWHDFFNHKTNSIISKNSYHHIENMSSKVILVTLTFKHGWWKWDEFLILALGTPLLNPTNPSFSPLSFNSSHLCVCVCLYSVHSFMLF